MGRWVCRGCSHRLAAEGGLCCEKLLPAQDARPSPVAPAPGGLQRKLPLREERKEVGQQGRLVCGSQAAYVTGAGAPKGVQGAPFGPVVRNLPSNTGDAGSISGQGVKIPCAVGQLNLYPGTKPACSGALTQQLERSQSTAVKDPLRRSKDLMQPNTYMYHSLCSVAKSCLTLGVPMDCSKPARLLCPSRSPGACSNSRPQSRWCFLTISSSAAPFSCCLPSFPARGVISR